MFRVYQERGELTVGRRLLFKTSQKWILNFPTKRHWRQRSRIEDIEAGLKTFVATYSNVGITSIAFPQLGRGNGELDWKRQVRPLMERYLGALPIEVSIHLDVSQSLLPEHRDVLAVKRWRRADPQTLAFGEFWEDSRTVIDTAAAQGRIVPGWTVQPVETEIGPAPRFASNDQEVTLAREDLCDIWQQFRSVGLLARKDLPAWLSPAGSPLLDLMSR